MSLTVEQIKEALKGNKELENGLIELFKDTETGKELLDNYAEQYHTKEMKGVVESKQREVMDRIDDVLAEVSGLEKKHGEKTTDYAKRAFSNAGDSDTKSKISELQKKVDEYENKGSHNQHWQKTYETEKTEWLSKFEQLEKQLESEKTNAFVSDVQRQFDKARSELNINPALKDAFDMFYDSVIPSLATKAKKEGDTLQVFDVNGELIRNNKHGAATPKEILEKKSRAFLLAGQKGTAPKDKSEGSTKGKVSIDLDKVKNQGDFIEQYKTSAAAQGIDAESDDYSKAFVEAKENYDFDSLPES